MRIDRLELKRWGALEGAVLDFRTREGGAPGLHVVYGDNEAGKSTTRRAIGALLFGVPPQTPDGFRFDYKTLRLAASLRLADGSVFSFERRKGVKDTVRDVEDKPLDEAPLARVLHGIDREAFEREWSLDHDRLREGGRELLSGKGVLGESLLAAGLGGVGVKALQDQLQEEASKLAPLRYGLLRQLLDQIKARRTERDAHAVNPRRVEELDGRLQDLRRERRTLEDSLVALGKSLARLERTLRARPLLSDRDRLAAERARFDRTPVVAADFGKRRVAAQQSFDQAELDLGRVGDDLGKRHEALARIAVEEPVLERQTPIQSVVKGLEAFESRLVHARDAERDLKEWTAEIGRLSRRVGLSRDELESLANGPFLTLEERLAELALEGPVVRSEKAKAETSLAAARETIRELTRAAGEAPALPEENAALRRAHDKAARGLEGAERDLERLRARAREATQKAETALERLAPRWTRGAEALVRAPLPRVEDLEAPTERQRAAAEELTLATNALDEATRERERVARALAKLVAGGEVPTEAALNKARSRRQAGWQLVRPLALGQAPDPDALRKFLSVRKPGFTERELFPVNATLFSAVRGDLPTSSEPDPGATDAAPVATDAAPVATDAAPVAAKSRRRRSTSAKAVPPDATVTPGAVPPTSANAAAPDAVPPDNAALLQAFEQAVERSDDLSDRLRHDSLRAAKLEQLEDETEKARVDHAAARARLTAAEAEVEAARVEWLALFAEARLEAAAPKVMLRFLASADEARELLRAAAEARRELEEREVEVAALLAPLAQVLGRPVDLGHGEALARDLSSLLEEAQERLRDHDAARKAHDESRKELARAKGAVEKLQRELDEALAAERTWTAELAQVARAFNLPTAASLKQIQVVGNAVHEAAGLQRQILNTGPRLASWNAEQTAYLEQVAALVRALGDESTPTIPIGIRVVPSSKDSENFHDSSADDDDSGDTDSNDSNTDDDDDHDHDDRDHDERDHDGDHDSDESDSHPSSSHDTNGHAPNTVLLANVSKARIVETVGSLDRRLQAARTAASQRATERARTHELETQRQATLARLETARAALARLCEEAGTDDPRALVQVENDDQARRALDARLEKADAELAGLATEGLEGLRREVAAVPADEQAVTHSRVTQELVTTRALLATKSEEVGAAESELAKIAGSALATEDEAEVQSLLAQLRETSAEYLRLRYAGQMLRDAAERYRAENQSPILRRTSELLARLTLGSFSGVAVDEDAREIQAVRGDREMVSVLGLSDGVRDQLFLALRLAALEHHLAQREPLPFVVDDILIQLSDDRARATLEVLAELGHQTQVLLFTHHSRIAEIARGLKGEIVVHRVGAPAPAAAPA